MTDTATENPLRPCDECGGVDRAPRHEHGTVGETGLDFTTREDVVLRQLANAPDDEARAAVLRHAVDRTSQLRHMDCCRAAGCPTGECNTYGAQGAEQLRDDELREHIQTNYPRGLHGERADDQPADPQE